MSENLFNSPYIAFIIEDFILLGIYKEDLEINLSIAKKMVEDRLLFMPTRLFKNKDHAIKWLSHYKDNNELSSSLKGSK